MSYKFQKSIILQDCKEKNILQDCVFSIQHITNKLRVLNDDRAPPLFSNNKRQYKYVEEDIAVTLSSQSVIIYCSSYSKLNSDWQQYVTLHIIYGLPAFRSFFMKVYYCYNRRKGGTLIFEFTFCNQITVWLTYINPTNISNLLTFKQLSNLHLIENTFIHTILLQPQMETTIKMFPSFMKKWK